MKKSLSKLVSMVLAATMLAGMVPVSAMAATDSHGTNTVGTGTQTADMNAPVDTGKDGLVVENGKTYYYINGVPSAAGLVKVGGDYYYINSSCQPVSGNYEITRTNGLLLPGFYQFAKDGKMIDPPVYEDGPNKNGSFYKDGIRQNCYQLVAFDGNYYYISDYNKYARNITLFLNSATVKGMGINPGYYYFDADGVMSVKDGPDSNGYFYLNGVRQNCYQLIAYKGDYYFISDGHKYAKNCTLYLGAQYVKGTDLSAGSYRFDESGKLITLNGPNSNGYFYLDGIRQNCYQLIAYKGEYYFISDGHKYAKDCTLYLGAQFVKGTNLSAGSYRFDESGRLITLNGPNSDGYFYLDGIRQNCYQLIAYNGDYYFISDGHKYAKDCTLYLGAQFVKGTGLSAGSYRFDESGKLITLNGPNSDGYFYLNGIRQKCYQLVEYKGDWYFISDGHKYAKDCTLYLGAQFVKGTGLSAGNYRFDESGKLVTLNGPEADGYFYLNGIRQNCYQLIAYNGDYYFISDGHKYAKDCTMNLGAQFVKGTGLSAGNYRFDESGKLITLNGPESDGYFYLNGIRQKCYQLVEYKGDWYFISDGHKYAKNCTMYLGAQFVKGTNLSAGSYRFDESGKLIALNGPEADGYFYLNGIRQNCYQLIAYKGSYYFISDGHKYAKNCSLYLSAQFVKGTGLSAGTYKFNADGRMATKNGPDADGYFYINGVKQQAYQLVKYNGDYYFIYDGNKIAKNRTIFCSKQYVDGTDFRVWDYWFDADGKMVGYYEGVPNGRDIGDIYFIKTTDGRDVKSGLLIRGGELDNANYYYPDRLVDIGIDRIKNVFNVKFDFDLRAPGVIGKDLFGSEVAHKTYNMVLYDQLLTAQGKAAVKEVFTDLANPDNYPVYLHCTHGIDRTGIVCMLLEMALGVSYQSVFEEYLMSVGAHDGSFLRAWNSISDNYAGETEKDKTIAYLKDCGITQEQIDSLYRIYLD